MRVPVIHVVGAGLAGLAAAVRLKEAGADVVLYEAAGQAGGRTRSYYEPEFDAVIDNGNHLMLSGNHETLAYLRAIGAEDQVEGPAAAEYPFMDLATGERWCLRPNGGRVPWWVLHPGRRVPGTNALDYLGLWKLLRADPELTIGAVMPCSGVLYDRLWRPLLVAALNTEPADAVVGLAAAVVRESLAVGGDACRPLVAVNGLSSAFVDPALRYLEARGGAVHFGHRLRRIGFAGSRVSTLEFGTRTVELGPNDAVVLAVPAWVAASLIPGLSAPTAYGAIVNAHFQVAPPAGLPRITGVVNGTIEWLFAFSDRLSITISSAERLLDSDRETLARDLWREVAAVAGLNGDDLPPWQIIKEKRATFLAVPEEELKRPPAQTAWTNLALAGDWTATGLPATIEGAIRSGTVAADLIRG